MDDVQHLARHSREESYLIVVDSRARDTARFGSPSEYEIAFNSPFRNVFGLDLLDASVARTEYIVDETTNTLDYAVGHPPDLEAWASGAWARANRRTVRLTPGDYNLPQFVAELNARLRDAGAASPDGVQLRCATDSSPGEISNKVVFACAVPFCLLMATSTLRHTLGFGDPVTGAPSTDYATVTGWSVNRTGGASDVFCSLPAANLPDAEAQVLTTGPVPAAPGVQFEALYGPRKARQHFTAAATGPATAVTAYFVARPGSPAVTVRVRRAADDVELASGTVAGTELAGNAGSDTYEPVAVPLAWTAPLQAGEAYVVEFTAPAGTAQSFAGLYYNEDNLPVGGDRFLEVYDGAWTTPHVGSHACCDVIGTSWGHAVRSPGLVNLTGPRFVNIRCPEVESHMFRDRVNERCHAGLGMVQLRGYGFREQRFDFVSFPPRRFHPIARLAKLTFRLERPDGTLYDSQGVDHTLLLVVKYYATPAPPEPAPSTLNPEYTPDIHRWMIERRWAEEARATDRTLARY